VAESTFNRELGASPEGITRFRQNRTSDGGNVTINSATLDTSEGSKKRADLYAVTSSVTGTGTVTLHAGAKDIKSVYILSGVNGEVLGSVDAPKISNRSDVSFTFSVGASIENYLYVEKTDRSPCEYRLTYTAAV